MDDWDAFRASTGPVQKIWIDGLHLTPEGIAPLVRRALESLDHDVRPPPDVELHATLLALFGPTVHYDDTPRHEALTGLAAAVGGLTFALDVTIAAAGFEHVNDGTFHWLGPASDLSSWQLDGWFALRGLVQKATAAERKLAATRALEHRRAHGPAWALAWIFPEEPGLFTEEDARYGLTCTEDPGPLYDLACLRQHSLDVSRASNGWGVVGLPDASMISRLLGKEALPALRRYVVFTSWDTEDAAASEVAKLGGVDALRVLVEAAHREKVVLPCLLEAAAADPVSAEIAIRSVLDAAPKKVAAQYRRTRPLERPVLEAVLAMTHARLSPLPEEGAALTSLPAALQSPAWIAASGKATKPAKTKTKAPAGPPKSVAHEDRLDWGERDPRSLVHPKGDDASDQRVLERLRSERSEDRTFFIFQLSRLGDAAARTLLAEIPPTDWYGHVDDLEAILARFGLEALPPVLRYVSRQPDRFGAMLVVESPSVAGIAAHLFATSKKNGAVASEWLAKFPRAATIGLVAALAVEKGKTKESIEKALAFVRTKHPAVVDAVLEEAGATAFVGEAQAATASKGVKVPKLPAYLDLSVVARPKLRGAGAETLSLAATADLVRWLILSPRATPLPEIAELRDALDPESLDRFAWSLFVPWLAAGGPSKDPFALDAIGHFGSATTLRTFTEASREWAPGGLPSRAQAVVDVLALAPGTVGIAGIHRLSRVQSRALAKHATDVLAKVAAQRGMSADDLLDRLIPDLGLDADGSFRFDFGARAFSLGFDAAMESYVTDAEGKRYADLPKPRADEEETAGPAVAAWKEIKKKAKSIVREQARRLEVALGRQRRFSVEHFESAFAKHALLVHLARRLVWGLFKDGTLETTFRVAEDGTYADLDDATLTLDADHEVGLVHPLLLPKPLVVRWGERLSDYEIIQPFDQIGRATYPLRDDERDALTLTRTTGKVVPTGKVLGLDKLGWTRGDSVQGGVVGYWQKEGPSLHAILPLDPGVYLGMPMEKPEQTLGSVEFFSGRVALGAPLGTLDPVFMSELLRDLESLIV